MKSEQSSKRNNIQWTAFGIVMLTLVIRITLILSGIAQDLEYSTMNAITWTGFAVGIIFLLVSYLFPKGT
ncbi:MULTISPECIES: hypothetical protein [Bacillaceae]|uniref:hypothetical protein n=1 Tax=Bacillales TaxID=1385 RepID=UPI0018840DCB|nr:MULTISPECIES: hypothetical protein [Bacillaceae]MBF0707756.1 hypothetical protein [Pseudalkalibacillus hwajinpoensis]MDO6654470.1 hypothetical protein [Anaerobacillus sp. 1_MG-2023]